MEVSSVSFSQSIMAIEQGPNSSYSWVPGVGPNSQLFSLLLFLRVSCYCSTDMVSSRSITDWLLELPGPTWNNGIT